MFWERLGPGATPTTHGAGTAVAWILMVATVAGAWSCATGSEQSGGTGGAPGGTGGTATGGTATGGASTGSGGAGTGGKSPGSGGAGTGGAGTGGAGTGGAGTTTGSGGSPAGTGGAPTTPVDAGAGTGGANAGDGSFGACDPFTNAGCSGGMKCTALQSGTMLVIGCGAKGTKAAGATCTPTLSGSMQTGDDCAEGLACFSVQGQTGATCKQICPDNGASGTACPSPMTCSLRITGLTTVAFCQMTTSCSPLAQTPCTSTQGCYLTPSGPTCATAGTKKPGDACTAANDCGRGSTCLVTNGAGKCSFYCSTAAGGTPMCSGTATGGATCAAQTSVPSEPTLGTCN